MKKIIVKTMIVMMVIMLVNIIYIPKMSCVLAIGSVVVNDGGGGQSEETRAKYEFLPEYYKPNSTNEVENADKFLIRGNKILGWLNTIAIMVSAVVMGIIGIKYMVGSVEEKAQYKKSMAPYMIGCTLVFGVTTILKIISSIASSLNA